MSSMARLVHREFPTEEACSARQVTLLESALLQVINLNLSSLKKERSWDHLLQHPGP